MKLDKDLYRKAYELHRQWNIAEVTERIRNPESLTPQDAFQRYASLVELCWKLSRAPSEKRDREKMVDLVHYYETMRKIEAWRLARGKTT